MTDTPQTTEPRCRFRVRVTRMTVLPEGEPLFSEKATDISLVDEAEGEFLEIKQERDQKPNSIQITTEEWPALKEAMEKMIEECCDIAPQQPKAINLQTEKNHAD